MHKLYVAFWEIFHCCMSTLYTYCMSLHTPWWYCMHDQLPLFWAVSMESDTAWTSYWMEFPLLHADPTQLFPYFPPRVTWEELPRISLPGHLNLSLLPHLQHMREIIYSVLCMSWKDPLLDLQDGLTYMHSFPIGVRFQTMNCLLTLHAS